MYWLSIKCWCDLDIFGWIRSAWCWFDLISHPPNFIFAAFNMFGEFYIFDFFWKFFDFWNFIKDERMDSRNSRIFTFERKCLLLKINKQTWGNLEFKSQGITKMDDSQAVCLSIINCTTCNVYLLFGPFHFITFCWERTFVE